MSKKDETNGFPTVLQTVGVYLDDGDHIYQQGIKGDSTKTFSKNGCKHSHNGYGGDSITIPSDLFLEFRNSRNQVLSISIKQELREAAGFQRFTITQYKEFRVLYQAKLLLRKSVVRFVSTTK